jgi:tripartite-type tricarboxylate transporter receptor subunit TctC
MNRREVLKAGLGSVAVASAGWMSSGPARAANWPTKTVRVIVPFSAGSATDLVPRAVFEQVSKQVGQTILVDNRPGGGGAIGIGAVRAADPDGHTILVHSNSFITTPAIQPMPWDPPRDFAGITPLGNVPLVLVIAPSQGIKTLKELVDRSKAKPGSLNYAAAGIGSPPHLTMERFRVAAGFTGQLVPFRGAPEALTEVMAGRVDVYFCPITPALPLIADGKLLPLAVSSSSRATGLPQVPTTVEAGYPNSGFDFWIGAMVVKQTPRPVVETIHAEVVKALNSAPVKERLGKMAVEPLTLTPAQFDARIAKETPEAVELAKAAGVAKPK